MNQLSGSSPGGGADRAEKRKKRDDLSSQRITLQNTIDAQNTTISQLQATLKTYQAQATIGGGAEDFAKQIQTNIDRLNKEYEAMQSQLQNAANVNVAPEINFKQTLVGQPAIKPEHSGRKVIIGVGGIAALILSSLWIIIMDFLDQS